MERTFNQQINELIEHAKTEREQVGSAEEGRDLSISITHLEDARTRYNSSRYRRYGAHIVRDPDADHRDGMSAAQATALREAGDETVAP